MRKGNYPVKGETNAIVGAATFLQGAASQIGRIVKKNQHRRVLVFRIYYTPPISRWQTSIADWYRSGNIVLLARFELATSSLPRMRATG